MYYRPLINAQLSFYRCRVRPLSSRDRAKKRVGRQSVDKSRIETDPRDDAVSRFVLARRFPPPGRLCRCIIRKRFIVRVSNNAVVDARPAINAVERRETLLFANTY